MSEIRIIVRQRAPKEQHAGARAESHSTDRLDYRTEADSLGHTKVMHIPVGMPAEAWQAYLHDGHVRATFSHARWCARRIASNIETMRRGGAYYWRKGTQSRAYSAQDCLDTIRLDKKFLQRIGMYQVHHKLHEYTYNLAKALVEARIREVRR